MKKITENKWVMGSLVALVVLGGILGFGYWYIERQSIYTDKAEIEATAIHIAPVSSGVLQEVFVKRGDRITKNAIVARVGNELLKTKTESVVTSVSDSVGSFISSGTAVVSVIDPGALRLVGHIDENKGLSSIAIGQSALFTVDAFGSQKFQGIVDEISPSARQNDVVFSISDKRETKVFDVEVRFDAEKYNFLQNGMSAKLWIYKK